MPGLRAIASSAFAALVVGLIADLWFRWPGFLAVAIGALFGVASLIVTGSLETRGAAADQAWRTAAPDLHARSAATTDPDPARRPSAGDAGDAGDAGIVAGAAPAAGRVVPPGEGLAALGSNEGRAGGRPD